MLVWFLDGRLMFAFLFDVYFGGCGWWLCNCCLVVWIAWTWAFCCGLLICGCVCVVVWVLGSVFDLVVGFWFWFVLGCLLL